MNHLAQNHLVDIQQCADRAKQLESNSRNWKEHKQRIAQAVPDGTSMDIDMCKAAIKIQKMD